MQSPRKLKAALGQLLKVHNAATTSVRVRYSNEVAIARKLFNSKRDEYADGPETRAAYDASVRAATKAFAADLEQIKAAYAASVKRLRYPENEGC